MGHVGHVGHVGHDTVVALRQFLLCLTFPLFYFPVLHGVVLFLTATRLRGRCQYSWPYVRACLVGVSPQASYTVSGNGTVVSGEIIQRERYRGGRVVVAVLFCSVVSSFVSSEGLIQRLRWCMLCKTHHRMSGMCSSPCVEESGLVPLFCSVDGTNHSLRQKSRGGSDTQHGGEKVYGALLKRVGGKKGFLGYVLNLLGTIFRMPFFLDNSQIRCTIHFTSSFF